MITTRKLLKPGNRVWISLILTAVVLSACDRSRTDKGYNYFPDMFYSPAFKTYSDNPALPGEHTMLEPPEGSLPRGFIQHPYENSFEGRALAGKELSNPFTPDVKLVEEGKELYKIFCMNCHGLTGDGSGFLHTSGKYPIRPASLITEEIKAKPSGEIYHVITKGWGVMGAHGSQIRPEDRWKIVMFVEEILQQQ